MSERESKKCEMQSRILVWQAHNALFVFRAVSALYTVSPAQQRRTFWPSVFTGNKSINAHSGHARQSAAQTLWPAFGNEAPFAVMTLMTICLSSSEALPSVPGEPEHLVGFCLRHSTRTEGHSQLGGREGGIDGVMFKNDHGFSASLPATVVKSPQMEINVNEANFWQTYNCQLSLFSLFRMPHLQCLFTLPEDAYIRLLFSYPSCTSH